ncbi:MAG: tRNA pseudouridine(55) synthase TruB [Phycisphaerales bacterium]|nr:tRNA pseudouridine(55) synthase TruB [Phycisphaerales bacterium]
MSDIPPEARYEPPTPPPRAPVPIGGMVLVDKPASLRIKSTTVVRSVKRRLIAGGCPRSIKVGHAGTLDPLASGLLIVLVGRGTRWCERLMAREKEYVATIDLSRWSPTDDLEVEPTPHDGPIEIPAPEKVAAVLTDRFTGTIQQRPPAFSAIWVDGKRAYKSARAGDAPELKPRPIDIHEMTLVDYAWPLLTLDIRCGKGTYIRSLARDIGEALTGKPGVLTALRRTAIGPYRTDNAIELDALPVHMTPADLTPLPGDDQAAG